MPTIVLLLLLGGFVLVSVIIIASPPPRKLVKPRSPAKRPSYECIPSGRGGYMKKWTFEGKLMEDIRRKAKLKHQLQKAQSRGKRSAQGC